MSDPLLEEANRRAHRLARIVVHRRRLLHDIRSMTLEDLRRLDREHDAACDAYEEIERRQEREATA